MTLELDQNLEGYYDDKKNLNHKLEQMQTQERDTTSKINDESKEMEKLANKQSMLIKKVFYTQISFTIFSNIEVLKQ